MNMYMTFQILHTAGVCISLCVGVYARVWVCVCVHMKVFKKWLVHVLTLAEYSQELKSVLFTFKNLSTLVPS